MSIKKISIFGWTLYSRWFWVEDSTKGMDVWFDKNYNILPEDYVGGNCSSAAHPKNWKEANRIVDALFEHGCEEVRVIVFTTLFGIRRSTDYEYYAQKDKEADNER